MEAILSNGTARQAEVRERVWMTYTEAARHCHLDRSTLWRAVKRGELHAGGVGRAVRFEKAELDRFMRTRRGDESQ